MSMAFDVYVERSSWLHRVDPRVKLLFVLLGSLALTLFSNLLFMLAALLAVQALILSARVPRDRLAWVWRAMLPINLLIPALWTLFYPEGSVLLALGPVRLTPVALLRGLGVAARLDSIAFIGFSWLFTTDQRAIVRSLVKIGLPFEWGLVLAISLRYLPAFQGLYSMVVEAQQARALDLTRGGLWRRLRSRLPILVAVMISALRMADRLARSLESRALGVEGVERTYLHDIRLSHRDYALLVALVVGFGGMVGLRLLGWFTHPLYPLPV